MGRTDGPRFAGYAHRETAIFRNLNSSNYSFSRDTRIVAVGPSRIWTISPLAQIDWIVILGPGRIQELR